MAKFPFLSEQWVAEARRIYAEAEASGALAAQVAPVAVRVNLVVTEAPFSPGPLDAHVDTSGGKVAIDTGHVADPDVTVSMDYVTARSLFVSGDVQSVMQAFLSGRIKVDGDLSKLIDPRSRIWPASGPGAGGPGSRSGAPTQPPLGASSVQALLVTTRLQEITE
ncbi:MAG: SCP2 sterol-binding domain-containing protein [Acidimicrobiales bacterium]